MGKRGRIGIGVITLAIAGSIMTTVLAGSSVQHDPGSVNDPIVTKSYVDEQVRLKVQQELSQFQQQLPAQDSSLKVLQLGPKDVLIGKQGTEIIVRTGKVVAYGDGSNGIPDITGGVDVAIWSPVKLNHLLIVPKDDGRGILVVEGTTFVMIKGDYEIKKAN